MVTYLSKANNKSKLDINQNNSKNRLLIAFKSLNHNNSKTSSVVNTSHNNNQNFDQIIDSKPKSTTISSTNADRNEEKEAKTTSLSSSTTTESELENSESMVKTSNDLSERETTDETIDGQINCNISEELIDTKVTNNNTLKHSFKDKNNFLDFSQSDDNTSTSGSSSAPQLPTNSDECNNDFNINNNSNCDKTVEELDTKNKKKYVLAKSHNYGGNEWTNGKAIAIIGETHISNSFNDNIINGSVVTDASETEFLRQQSSCEPTAKAVLICRKNSHPFVERHVFLEGSVKVGRAVAKIKPSGDNFIFDCKVLSRNHASLWFKNQKFFLQDTRSSNGTFVNNTRLSPANEESQPREVHSGDVVQFGVDVMENSRKVTHGCIIATIKLYYPDGVEARLPENSQNCSQSQNQSNVCITSQQLYELSQYLNEAIHREQILENKLETLQRVVSSANESANIGWKSLVEEDRLLSRIETLQNKLEICLTNKETNDDNNDSPVPHLKEEMLKLIDDKEKYESAAKEAIQKALEEKLIVLQRLQEFETSIESHEKECNRLQEVCETSAQEINRLANINDELNKEIESYMKRLKSAEDQKINLIEATTKEKEETEDKILKLKAKERENNEIISELKSINYFSNIEIEKLKLQVKVRKQSEEVIRDGKSVDNNNVFSKSMDSLVGHQNECKLNLEEELVKVKKQLDLSYAQNSELSAELKAFKQQTVSTVTLTESTTTPSAVESKSSLINGQILSTNETIVSTNDVCVDNSVTNEVLTPQSAADTTTDQKTSQQSDEIKALEELLAETRASKKSMDEELSRTLTELENLRSLTKQLSSESDEMQHRLDKTLEELEEKNVLITSLKNKINDLSEKMRNCLKESETIRCKICENENLLHLKDDELSSLKGLLEEERKVQQKYANNYEICRKQLSEQQVVAKQCQTEAELLRKKVYSCNEELRSSRSNLSVNTSDEINKELHKLETECHLLRTQLNSRESELSSRVKQHQELSADYQSLQNSLQLLKQINTELESRGDNYWKERYNSAKSEAQTHETELFTKTQELEELRQKFENCFKSKETLSEDLKSAEECIELFSYQSKTATACAVVPLIMLLIAVLMAYYPSVSTVTGTTDL